MHRQGYATGSQRGLSLVEVLVAMTLSASLLTGLHRFVGVMLARAEASAERALLTRDAQFGLARMQAAVCEGDALYVPSADNPLTIAHVLNASLSHREDIREQTVPATLGSAFSTAVLAVAAPAARDFDGDGIADTDLDGDGASFEDPGADLSADGAAGLVGIDDDGDGLVDEGLPGDDDEDGLESEDPVNGVDDDGDGRIDEDPGADIDLDGNEDDDGDGASNEAGTRAVVFYIAADQLVERRPDRNAATGSEYTEFVIAEPVRALRFQRLTDALNTSEQVSISLQLGNDADAVVVDSTVRVGCGS